MRCLYSLLVGAVFSLAHAESKPSWQGQRILLKHAGASITLVESGKKIVPGWKGEHFLEVSEEREGKLRVVGLGATKEGWIAKDDAVFLADAIDFFSQEIATRPDSWAFAMRGLARVLNEDQKGYDKATADYTESIRLDPTRAMTFLFRGNIWCWQKKLDKSLADYSKAIQLDPTNAMGFYNRAYTLHEKGDFDKALEDFDTCIRLDPKMAMAFFERGNNWKSKKNYAKALSDYRKSCELDPEFGPAWEGLAWLLATCPDVRLRDGKAAIAAAQKAIPPDGSVFPNARATLAAAYAEAGDFDEAVRQQQKVIETLDNGAESQRRLKLYQAKQKYRED